MSSSDVPQERKGRARFVAIGAVLLALVAALLVRFYLLPHPVAVVASVDAAAPELPAPPMEDRTPEIRGRILDSDGNPVNGAAVRLLAPGPPLTVVATTKSESAGAFSFAHVPPGPARVVADHDADGYVSSADLHPNAASTTEVTLVLSATRGVRGNVVDGDKHPVAAVTLSVEGPPWTVPTATSDDTGVFHLIIVPDEATAVVATARGYATVRVVLGPRGPDADLVVRIQLRVAPPVTGEVVGVDGRGVAAEVVACAGQSGEARTASAEDGTFELPAESAGCEAVAEQAGGASSSATMIALGQRNVLRLRPGGAIEGLVVDEGGRGVSPVTVGVESYVSPRGRRVNGGGPQPGSDPGGAFRLENLAPGTYVLTAWAAGRPPTRSDPVEVAAATVTRGVRIVLPRGGSVSGRVTDERHTPIAGVEVRFDSVSRVVDSHNAVRTDEVGRYRLDGAPAGLLTLRAQKAGFRSRLLSGLTVASGVTLTQDITLTATADGGTGLELTGIGATMMQGEKGIEIAAVGAGDPAETAGLKRGDRLTRIDGESAEGMSVADAVQRLRGPTGTSVGVSVERPKTGEVLDVMVVRAAIVR